MRNRLLVALSCALTTASVVAKPAGAASSTPCQVAVLTECKTYCPGNVTFYCQSLVRHFWGDCTVVDAWCQYDPGSFYCDNLDPSQFYETTCHYS